MINMKDSLMQKIQDKCPNFFTPTYNIKWSVEEELRIKKDATFLWALYHKPAWASGQTP